MTFILFRQCSLSPFLLIKPHYSFLLCSYQVEFSDESETETANTLDTQSGSISSAPKPASEPSQSLALGQVRPRRTRTVKKSTALRGSSGSSEEEMQPRRGRSRKAQSSNDVDKPERMRMIREDMDGDSLDISLEDLQESESEMVNTGESACVSACLVH